MNFIGYVLILFIGISTIVWTFTNPVASVFIGISIIVALSVIRLIYKAWYNWYYKTEIAEIKEIAEREEKEMAEKGYISYD